MNIGAFPPSPPNIPSQPSFFASALPAIRDRLSGGPDTSSYSDFWAELLSSLSSSLTVQSIGTSLFGHVIRIESALDPSPRIRALVKGESELLRGLMGSLNTKNELWDNIVAIILGREWPEGHARVFACWAATSQVGVADEDGKRLDLSRSDDQTDELLSGLGALLDKTLDVWSSSEYIKHSLLSRHHCWSFVKNLSSTA